jgi:hypothetical protein
MSKNQNSKIVAFADEYGNNSFDFKEQSTHFIVATEICKEGYLPEFETKIDEIRKKHGFQTGEIKSSNIAGHHTRRIRVLEDIVKLEIAIYAVVIDKRKLNGPGFDFKRSFYKFTNNLLYKELFRTYPDLDLSVDEHGGNDFLIDFKKYIAKQHPRTLFDGADFNVLNSKNSKFIQVADLIAGTLGHVFDEHKKSEDTKKFLGILKPRIADINVFPKDYNFMEIQESNIDAAFEPQIAQLAYLRMQTFLETTIGTNQQKIDQINFLKLLQLYQRVNAKSTYITTKEILRHLNPGRPKNMNEEYFRTKVVGNLRDKGVLISSSRAGYKIPTSINELKSFITHGKRVILPMVNRLKQARTAIKLATGNELDLLNNQEYFELKKLLDA